VLEPRRYFISRRSNQGAFGSTFSDITAVDGPGIPMRISLRQLRAIVSE
jgi:hypothetical protein